MSRKESDIQRAILDYLKALGIMAWRQKNEGTWDAKRGFYRKGTGTPGLPDIGGILPRREYCTGGYMVVPGGRALFIEVKAGRKKPTPEQLDFLARARKAGALAFVAYSVEDVINKLKEEGI